MTKRKVAMVVGVLILILALVLPAYLSGSADDPLQSDTPPTLTPPANVSW